LTGGQPAPVGGTLLDTGGKAASFMLAQADGQKNAEEIVEKLDVLSKTLRAKTIIYILKTSLSLVKPSNLFGLAWLVIRCWTMITHEK